MQSSRAHSSPLTALNVKEETLVRTAGRMIIHDITQYQTDNPTLDVYLNEVLQSAQDEIDAILNAPPPERIAPQNAAALWLLHTKNRKSFFENNPTVTEDNIWRYRYALLNAYLTNLLSEANGRNNPSLTKMIQDRLQQIRQNRADALPHEVEEVGEISYVDFMNQQLEREYKAYIAGIRQLKADNALNQHVQKLADLAERYCANRDSSRYQECVTVLRPALTLINPGATRDDKEKANLAFLKKTQDCAEQRETSFKKNFLVGMMLISGILLMAGSVISLLLPPPWSFGVAAGMAVLGFALVHLAKKKIVSDPFFHSDHNPGFFTKPTLKEVKAIIKQPISKTVSSDHPHITLPAKTRTLNQF